jgi:hypothetical protein
MNGREKDGDYIGREGKGSQRRRGGFAVDRLDREPRT